MQVEIKGDEIIIRLPVRKPPTPSATGKTLIVATSNGNQPSSAQVNGKPVVVGVNAYIPNR